VRLGAAIGAVLASSVVLLGGWQLGMQHTVARVSPAAPAANTGANSTAMGEDGENEDGENEGAENDGAGSSVSSVPTPAATPGTASGSSSGTAGGTASGSNGTFTGADEQTPYGDVQVSVTISGGKITEVKALRLTNQGGRSVQISNRAAPMLRSEVLKAQSANVNSISGATYTSEGYLTSLQSALDSAHFG
jgi:uncharacterized protein with FMN-binding domain